MPRQAQVKKSESFLSQIKWGESYTSLFLGAVVVIIALILLFSFLKAKNVMKQQTGSTSTNVEQKIMPTTYTVKEGESLWSIAEKLYGSGYNWIDLASANKLQDPGLIFTGDKLVVPNVKPRIVENNIVTTQTAVSTTPITGKSYTVVKGDCLWTIAVRAYGDGYKWTEIAKANNLTNPDLIYPGNVFVLPR